MANITLAFVAGPAATPQINELLTTDPAWATITGFTLGAPTFEGAPFAVGVQYGYRTCSFTIRLIGAYSTVASKMQTITRQLLQDQNWLMVKWLTTPQPMFLRTYRTAQAAADWTLSLNQVWDLPVELECEPFLYGAPRTIGPVTITNNPASGTNPMWYKFPAIAGDAPAGLKVSIAPSATWDDYSPLMATAALDPSDSAAGPVFWQTGGFTLGTNTAVGATSGFSGSNSTLVSPGSNQPTAAAGGPRLTGPAPSTLTPGTYKVLVRVQRSDTSSTFALALGQLSGLTSYTYPNPDVTLRQGTSATGFATWVDLGEFTLPIGAGGLDLADIGTAVAPSVQLSLSRMSGSGNLSLDVFLLIPVDTATTVDTYLARTAFSDDGIDTTITGVWDGSRVPSQFRAYVVSSGALSTLKPPRIDGRFLKVVPGFTNIFHLVQQTKTDDSVPAVDNKDSITATAAVTFTYTPRYLHVVPDTT